jgi:hypothetical protein
VFAVVVVVVAVVVVLVLALLLLLPLSGCHPRRGSAFVVAVVRCLSFWLSFRSAAKESAVVLAFTLGTSPTKKEGFSPVGYALLQPTKNKS